MDINDNYYQDFISLLNKHKVQYILVGGYAVNFHGYSRFTGDLDIWVNNSNENNKQLLKAIEEFGYDTEPLKNIDLNHNEPIKLTEELLKIDILHDLVGDFTFDEAYERRDVIEHEGLMMNFINYRDLINNKETAKRMKDLVDVYHLKELNKDKDI